MKNSFLSDERIFLRALEEADLDGNYIQWLNDEDVRKFTSHRIFPYTKGAALEYIRNSWNRQDSLILAIVLKNNNKHIGNISLQNINFINRSAEFAIIVGEKDYWGKGYSKEASVLLFKHAFFVINLNRIYCTTAAENIPMQKLAIYLGMQKEGCRRQNVWIIDKFMDGYDYGILRKEFLFRLDFLENKKKCKIEVEKHSEIRA